MYSLMDGCDHTTYVMYLSYQLYLSMQILGGSYMCSCKEFHPSLSLGPHALGGICYTVICHHWSSSLLPLIPYIGGRISGPVNSDIT